AEWISKEQEATETLWQMWAIAHSLVGLAARESDAQKHVKNFAGLVKSSASTVYKAADGYALRVKLEGEGWKRFQPLTESLNNYHFLTVAQSVLNPAETNVIECGEWLEKADNEGWSANELKRQIKAAQRAALAAAPWPDDTYRVIYADPPWEYSSSGLDQYGPAERHYTTMSTEKLCALDDEEKEGFASRVRVLTAEEAVLFMWATSPTLPDALEVIEAWGFKYKSSFVWDKVGHNYGHYNSVRHELLLVATKGSCLPDNSELYDSVVTVDKTSIHSQKPEVFREMIDNLYQYGPRIELFLRGEAPEGWAGWGNEAAA
ncbi:MAG: MT-A70 family methyltransferase, partial [Rubrobacteraceae bacterium]